MSLVNREWNVVALVAVALTLLYIGAATAAMLLDKITWGEFAGAVAPLATAWGGYLAAMINKTPPTP